VDPVVASLCGGAVGVLTTLLIVEQNNLENQRRNRCVYCQGSGYLLYATCAGTGTGVDIGRCAACQGTGKVGDAALWVRHAQ
jgi:hypothetical protein